MVPTSLPASRQTSSNLYPNDVTSPLHQIHLPHLFRWRYSMWSERDSSKKNGQPHFPIFTCCGTSTKSRYNIPHQGGTMKNPARTCLVLEYPRKCAKVCSSENIPDCTCLGIYQQQRHMGLHTKQIGFRNILCRNAIQ